MLQDCDMSDARADEADAGAGDKGKDKAAAPPSEPDMFSGEGAARCGVRPDRAESLDDEEQWNNDDADADELDDTDDDDGLVIECPFGFGFGDEPQAALLDLDAEAEAAGAGASLEPVSLENILPPGSRRRRPPHFE